MKEFLKKYLDEEQLKNLEEAYIKDHEGAKSLPVYISKARLDEVLSKQHTAESERDAKIAEIEKLKADNQKAIEEAVAKATEDANKAKDEALATQKKEFEITEAIYQAKGKNVVAIKALIDPTKTLKDEMARLQKEADYLFEKKSDDIPGGTGKQKGAEDSTKELDVMRKAVGLRG
jgi:membrane protein involved in colicin uptake